MRRWLACSVQLLLVSSLSFSQDVAKTAVHVSGTVPVDSRRIQLSAERPETQRGTIAQPPAAGPPRPLPAPPPPPPGPAVLPRIPFPVLLLFVLPPFLPRPPSSLFK